MKPVQHTAHEDEATERWRGKRSEGYLMITRGMTTTPKGKRTSAIYHYKSGNGIKEDRVEL
jgi:hypothetical protein